MRKILNFGSLNIDYVYSVDHMVAAGETLASSGLRTFCGGKGLNQSVAAARAGAHVWHAGQIGPEGTMLRDACSESGVNTEFIRTVEGKSGHTIIQVDRNGQNCILLYGGANREMTASFIDEVLGHFENGDILLLQNEINNISYLIDHAYTRGMRIALNPSPYDANLEQCDLSKVSVFILNEIEGNQISGEKEPEKILDRMRKLYPQAEIVLTLGSKGSICLPSGKEKRIYQGIYPVKAVDTTAAGDTFTGYYISSMAKALDLSGTDAGDSISHALDLAARASAIAVTRQGAVPSIPTMEEVLKYRVVS